MALNLVQTLVQMHVIDIFVPIVLIFAVVYSALWVSKKTGILSVSDNIMLVIALTISIIAVSPHVLQPGSKYDIVNIMMTLLPNIGLLFVGILAVLMLLGFIGADRLGSSLISYITIGIIVFVAYLFLVSINFLPSISGVDDSTMSALLALLVFGLIIYYITGSDKKTEDSKTKRETAKNKALAKIISGDFEKYTEEEEEE